MNPEPEPEYRHNASESLPETDPKDSDFLPTAEKTIDCRTSSGVVKSYQRVGSRMGVSPVWSGCSLRLTILYDINVAMETYKTSAYW